MSDVPAETTRIFPLRLGERLPQLRVLGVDHAADEILLRAHLAGSHDGPDQVDEPLDGAVGPGHEDVMAVPEHAPDNALDLCRGFPARQNHFRRALPQPAMVVNFRIAQVFVRQVAQVVHRPIHAQFSRADRAQHLGDFFRRQFTLA